MPRTREPAFSPNAAFKNQGSDAPNLSEGPHRFDNQGSEAPNLAGDADSELNPFGDKASRVSIESSIPGVRMP